MLIITFKYRYRKQIVIGIFILFLLVGGTILTIFMFQSDKKDKSDLVVSTGTNSLKKKSKKENIENYKVDIKGEILTPGIYTLKSNSRVIDVIEMSGGLTENADTSVINLSKKITDEMVIIVYSNAEVEDFKKTKELEKQVQESCIQKDENSLKNDACVGEASSNTGLISINTATEEELSSLSGIGPSKAKQIIEYRNSSGPFKTIEDIKQVPGIGESIYDQIKDYITT